MSTLRHKGVCVAVLLAAGGCSAGLDGADVSTVTYPFVGVTHIFRAGSPPDFPRNVNMHIVRIDLTAPYLSFALTPAGGTMDTLKMRTLDYINLVGAQIGMNTMYFNPVTSPAVPGGISANLNTEVIGFYASAGNIVSPFELPFQNYAILRDSPGINIDPNNHAGIVTAATGYSDGICYSCLADDGLHVQQNVTIWNSVAGSAQTITNGIVTIPCYIDATDPNCQLNGALSPASVVPPYSNTKSWYNLLNARSAIGLSQDNKTLFLFTVDAAGGSVGMMVGEVANVLLSYGVYNALNLDGGGSVSLAMQDPATQVRSLVNSQSNGAFAREIAANLAVFALPNTSLSGAIGSKSGSASARTWTIVLANTGPGLAKSASIGTVSLKQTSGLACTPLISSALPVIVGDISPDSSAAGSVTIDFAGCGPANRYSATFTYSADAGAVTGTGTLFNQFQ